MREWRREDKIIIGAPICSTRVSVYIKNNNKKHTHSFCLNTLSLSQHRRSFRRCKHGSYKSVSPFLVPTTAIVVVVYPKGGHKASSLSHSFSCAIYTALYSCEGEISSSQLPPSLLLLFSGTYIATRPITSLSLSLLRLDGINHLATPITSKHMYNNNNNNDPRGERNKKKKKVLSLKKIYCSFSLSLWCF